MTISLNDCRKYSCNAIALTEAGTRRYAVADNYDIEEVEEDDCSSNFVARSRLRTVVRYSLNIGARYSQGAEADYSR